MDRIAIIRFASLYLPLAWATLIAFVRPRRPRMFAACLLSLLWVLPALLILQRINLVTRWWVFAPERGAILAMPLEFLLGWAVLWGVVPPLTFRKLDLPEVLVLMGVADLWIMPLTRPALHFEGIWLFGEAAALVLVLAPAFCLARWTLDNTRLKLRAALQVAIAGLLFLFLLPEVAFAIRPAANMSSVWQPLIHTPSLLRQVTSGIYRYCANPMQLSCTVVMLLWAWLLRNPWLVLAAAMSTLYSAGIAHWDEERDLQARFHESWQEYRVAVPGWRFRWRPYHAGPPARLYMARTCESCSEIRRWMEQRHPIGLVLVDAETLPQGSVRRVRYDPGDGTAPVEGVAAFARALEHLNLAWAYCGMTVRLPFVRQVLQLLMDASGLGPRSVPSTCER